MGLFLGCISPTRIHHLEAARQWAVVKTREHDGANHYGLDDSQQTGQEANEDVVEEQEEREDEQHSSELRQKQLNEICF